MIHTVPYAIPYEVLLIWLVNLYVFSHQSEDMDYKYRDRGTVFETVSARKVVGSNLSFGPFPVMVSFYRTQSLCLIIVVTVVEVNVHNA
jgi:hypothetical protein